MPEFSNLTSIFSTKKALSPLEMIRAIKFAIASEFEAIQLYQQIIESTENEKIIHVLSEITEDEKHHVGGLYKLLEFLAPSDQLAYEKGYKETEENYK